MTRVGSAGSVSGDWSDQDSHAATVRAGESTLAQVASRLGVSPQDLAKANPQLADAEELTPGQEITLPSAGAGDEADAADSTDGVGEDEGPVDDTGFATSRRMESSMDVAMMRASLSSSADSSSSASWGTGGITHQPPVADPLHEGFTSQEKKDLTDKLHVVYNSPQFQALNAAEKDSVLHSLAGNPPLTQEKLSNALDLMASAKSLSPGDRKLLFDAFRAGHADAAYSANLKQLIDDPSFKNLDAATKTGLLTAIKDHRDAATVGTVDSLLHSDNMKQLLNDPKFKGMDAATKTAVLSQVVNYPDARTVGNIDRLVNKDWFATENLEDKQRSLKTIARFSSNPVGDRNVIDNTLDKLLGANSDYKLVWKDYPPGNGTTFGEGADKTLWLNRGIIDAGNEKIPQNQDTDRLSLNTVAHEINHLVNNDRVDKTFDYFNAEYRAWYVGFQSEMGRPPNNQEAMRARIQWQLDPESFYGKYAKEAMKDPAEAQKFYDFLGKVTGLKVDGSNWQNVLKSSPTTWPDRGLSPAPVPVGNNDNH